MVEILVKKLYADKDTKVSGNEVEMKKKTISVLIPILLMLALAACSLSNGQQSALDNAALGTIVAQNILLTQMSGTLQAARTPALPTATQPEPTPTVTLTPEFYYTATTQAILLTLTQNTNCRKGPASYYALVTGLKVGDQVEAYGQDPNNAYFYVKNPNLDQSYCWVWGKSVSVSGDTSGLPMFTPQPTKVPTATPTAAPSFNLSYNSLTNCHGKYMLRVFLRNTGGLTWQAIKMVITDTTTGASYTTFSTTFKSYNGCTVDENQEDLAQGEEGNVSNFNSKFPSDPTGHNLNISITLYSDNDETGTSATQTISVKP
jgi:hypothetical protein